MVDPSVRAEGARRPSLVPVCVGLGALLVVVAVLVLNGPDRSPTGSVVSPSPTPEASRSAEPTESALVVAQQAAPDAVLTIVSAYGATVPDDWAGLFIDQTAGGAVVALFKANIPEHRRALESVLPSGTRFEAREATWSIEELQEFMRQVEAERDWFPTIGTTFYAVETGALDFFNRVRIRFKGPDPSAAAAVEAHFGNPPWLRAFWYGPEEWTGARGDIEILVRDTAGRPVPGLIIDLVSLDDRVRSGELAWMTNKDGRSIVIKNLPAVAFRVRGRDHVAGELVVVGKARVDVVPDERTTVTVIVKTH